MEVNVAFMSCRPCPKLEVAKMQPTISDILYSGHSDVKKQRLMKNSHSKWDVYIKKESKTALVNITVYNTPLIGQDVYSLNFLPLDLIPAKKCCRVVELK